MVPKAKMMMMRSSSPPAAAAAQEEEEESVRSRVWSFLKMVSSDNSNVLLAALVCLLFVILFIFLLHFYARFFWSVSDASRHRRRRITRSAPVMIHGSALDQMNIDSTTAACTADKGLDSWAISSIPLFVYEDDEEGLECAICLGWWEVGDVGRKLRKCGHGFHVDCIDMWLSSHSTCPLCRAPVLVSTQEDSTKPAAAVEEVRVQVFPEEGDRRLAGEDGSTTPETGGCDVAGDRSSSSSVDARSMKRMLSRSRSERHKVFPAASNDSSEV